MRRLLTLTFISIFAITSVFAQAKKAKVYDENADPKVDIENAIELAKKDNKHVILFIGGNWCPWCLKLDKFIKSDEKINTALHDNYVVVKVNYDKKNKPMSLLETLDFPHRFGFPVLVILDKNGNRIHTQNSAYLEEDKGYSKKKLIGFFEDWTVGKLNVVNYK